MTLPQNVVDAITNMDMPVWDEADWQVVHAHLLSQESEIDRLQRQLDAGTGAGWHALRNERDELRRQLDATEETRDKFMWQVRDICRRAELAESRLAAANALLRRAVAPVPWGECDGLLPDIQAHLQGAGDE